jgi:hypothetical protein
MLCDGAPVRTDGGFQWLTSIGQESSSAAMRQPTHRKRSPLPCEQGRANFCGKAAGPQLSTLSFCLARISSWYLVASGWVDSRFAANAPLQSPDGATSPYGKATHDDLSVASLLRYSCHRLTTICASLHSFKLCSLVQLMFAATPEGEPRYLPAAQPLDLNSQLSTLKSQFCLLSLELDRPCGPGDG